MNLAYIHTYLLYLLRPAGCMYVSSSTGMYASKEIQYLFHHSILLYNIFGMKTYHFHTNIAIHECMPHVSFLGSYCTVVCRDLVGTKKLQYVQSWMTSCT